MMVEDNYYINVAKECSYPTQYRRYEHYCKIELGSISEEKAIMKFSEICTLFSKGKGFIVSLHYVTCEGHTVMKNYD